MSINHCVLMGTLTRDPELRYTPNGTAVCQVGLGLNRRYRDGAGELQEERSFVEVVVWGKQAEAVAAHMSKGQAVSVEGRLQQEQWETKTGEKRSRLTVVAQQVTFLPRNGVPPSNGEPAPDWVTEEG